MTFSKFLVHPVVSHSPLLHWCFPLNLSCHWAVPALLLALQLQRGEVSPGLSSHLAGLVALVSHMAFFATSVACYPQKELPGLSSLVIGLGLMALSLVVCPTFPFSFTGESHLSMIDFIPFLDILWAIALQGTSAFLLFIWVRTTLSLGGFPS